MPTPRRDPSVFLRHAFFVLFALGVQVGLFAQGDPELIFNMRKIGMEEGLLHRRVTQVVQDRQGFIWVATPAGVQRYDGFSFTNWTTAEGLVTNAVSVIWTDPDGMLWLVSKSYYSEGHISSIDILDPRDGTVRSYDSYFGSNPPCPISELADKAIVLQDGTLLLSAAGRLIYYRSAGSGCVTVPVASENVLRPMAVVRDGTLWCVEFRPREDYVHLVSVDPDGTVHRVPGGPFRLGSVGRVEDCDLRNGDHGLYFIGEPEGGAVHEYLLTPNGELVQLPAQLQADEIFQWNGALYMDLGEGNWLVDATVRHVAPGMAPRHSPILFDAQPQHPEISVGLHHAMRDRLGHIWIGSEFGLWQLDVRTNRFQRWLQRSDTSDGQWRSFRGLVVLGDTLYAASEQDGWYALNVNTGVSRRIDDGTWSLRYALAPDRRGGLWAGKAKTLCHWRNGRAIEDPLATDRVPLCMLPLDDGRLLLGTTHGLAWSDTALRTFSTFDPGAQGHLATATVAQLFRDRAGTIWECTSKGLGELTPEGTVRAIWWHGDSAHYLPAEDLRHIHEDDAGIFWVSTATNGLLRWDRSAGTFDAITRQEGLPSNGIYAVYPDEQGLLWMPTDNGIVRYDPITGQIGSFSTNDGIAHSEFNRLSHVQGPDGRLYFGGLDGITAFHPNDFRAAPVPAHAPLVISRFRKFDGREEQLMDLTAEVVKNGSFTLRPVDRFFTVNIALLSFDEPGSVLFGWRVDGVDADWNHQREPTFRFASLPYGTHALRFRAKSGSGDWTPELVVQVHVLRPWHLRWWAIALYVLTISGAVYALFRFRLARVRAMVAMRDRIALDLHDEVGSTLSSVALFSTVMSRSSVQRPDSDKAILDRIAKNSAQAMEGMNDIVWSVNTRYDKLADVEDRMHAYAGPIAEAKGWEMEIEVDDPIRGVRLNMIERKNLYLIFKEALNNAAKYAECRSVRVHLRREGQHVELAVVDDGVGIAPNGVGNGTLGGNGLRGMRQRAAEIKGELVIVPVPSGGTAVRLRFVPHAE